MLVELQWLSQAMQDYSKLFLNLESLAEEKKKNYYLI